MEIPLKHEKENKMEEIKLNGQYKKEDGKKIMRLINEIKLRSMRLAKIVDEIDMPIIANIMAMRLLQPRKKSSAAQKRWENLKTSFSRR